MKKTFNIYVLFGCAGSQHTCRIFGSSLWDLALLAGTESDPCIGRGYFNLWTTREVLGRMFSKIIFKEGTLISFCPRSLE